MASGHSQMSTPCESISEQPERMPTPSTQRESLSEQPESMSAPRESMSTQLTQCESMLAPRESTSEQHESMSACEIMSEQRESMSIQRESMSVYETMSEQRESLSEKRQVLEGEYAVPAADAAPVAIQYVELPRFKSEHFEEAESILSGSDGSKTMIQGKHDPNESVESLMVDAIATPRRSTLVRNLSRASKASTASEYEYPNSKQALIVMVAILCAVFLMALDRTIIATAIPAITDEFDSLTDIGWYGSAFMLTACCFQLVLGRVYTFYTPKYVFLTLIIIFEIGSAICGAAPNSVSFIIGRAIAGIGSAGIMSGAIILMVSVVPLAKRPIYQGLFGACFGVASVIGPLLGGAFTTDISWRWCFYINLPIGGAAMIAIVFLLQPSPPANPGVPFRQQIGQYDLLGELFLFPCIICLLLALQWGGSTYPWSDWRIVVLFIFFGLCLLAFIAVQYFMPNTATIPSRIIANRSILAGMWFTFCLASAMLAVTYFLPTWFQAIKGTTAVQSGIDTLPMVLALVCGSILSGQIIGRVGYYTPFALLSAMLMPIGAGLITTFTLDTPEGQWIGFQILFGFGIGCGMQQGAMAAQTVLSRRDVPMGVSLNFFCQQLGGAIFVSVGQNVFDSKLLQGLLATVQNLDPAKILKTGATDLRAIIPAQDLPEVLRVYNAALRQVFVVAVAMSCLAVLGAAAFEWRSVKGKQGPTKRKATRPTQHAESPAEAPVTAPEAKAAEMV